MGAIEISILTALYLFTAIVAGGLVLVSAFASFTGGQDAPDSTDLEIDPHAEADLEIDHHGDFHGDVSGVENFLPFLSLRFWIYFLAGFGGSGLLLTYLSNLSDLAALPYALVTGLVAGVGVWGVIRAIKSQERLGNLGGEDLVGSEAKVLIPLEGERPGKVRANFRGDLIDLVAYSDGGKRIEKDDTVLVIGFEENSAKVATKADLFEQVQEKR